MLHLGGDFGKSKFLLRPAGCSKKSQKIRGMSAKDYWNFWYFFVASTSFLQYVKQLMKGRNRH